MYKTHHSQATFGTWDVVEKVHAVKARSTFRSQKVQSTACTDHFWTFRSRFAWQAQGIVHLVKSEQNVRVLWHFQKRWQVRGTLEEDLQRWIFRGRRNTRDIFIGAVRRWGRWFPERGCILDIRSSSLLRWFCLTGAALRVTWHHFFVADAILSTGGLENRKTQWYEAVSSALNFPFLKEVSQNCFVFDVVKFKNWRSLADLLRFGCCPVQKIKKSRRIASFLMLSTSENEVVSQKSFVFKLADKQIDRQTEIDR